MENLPFLFLKELFGMMSDMNEVIRCSHVCRNWKAAYEALFKPETLCLHYEKTKRTVRLKHRLFYTNDRVSKLSFLKTSLPSNQLRFFDSASAGSHFAEIRKLVIFAAPADYANISADNFYKFRFKKQLNVFTCLEYAEFQFPIHVQEACEIDLPLLKILCFNACEIVGENVKSRAPENAKIILKTPSLQSMKVYTSDTKECVSLKNFKFLFPSSLRHLEMTTYRNNFKFDTKFDHLEVLIFSDFIWNFDLAKTPSFQLFANDFLKPLPSLKFLVITHGLPDLVKLEAEKKKFGLKDLKILDCAVNTFNYRNWQGYLEHKEQLLYWPVEFDLVYDKLIKSKISLDLFKENYFRIDEMKIRRVDNQPALVEFLKKVQIKSLELEYDCNLGQSFIDEIADSVILLDRLSIDECVWNRMTDFSALTRIGIFRFTVAFQRFKRKAAKAILKNPTCFAFCFEFYDGFTYVNWNNESRKDPNVDYQFSHYIQRAEGKDFLCNTCGWISCNDPNRFKGPVKVTIRHAAKGQIPPNLTEEQRQTYFGTV